MFKYSGLEKAVAKLIKRDFAIERIRKLLESDNEELFGIHDEVVFDLLNLPIEQEDVSVEKGYFIRDGLSNMYIEFISDSKNNTTSKIQQFIEEIKKIADEFQRKGKVDI